MNIIDMILNTLGLERKNTVSPLSMNGTKNHATEEPSGDKSDQQDKTFEQARAEMMERMLDMDNEELTAHIQQLADMIVQAFIDGRPIDSVVQRYALADVAPQMTQMWQGAFLRATLKWLCQEGKIRESDYEEYMQFLTEVTPAYGRKTE